ncbi:MAG: D-xylose ABC transporter ATP-binding protein, partial [Eubacteriales bacterium]|nr:D-xylose ABC transporter ATP-binding protein [Eubacteriales bacterium]
DVGAKYEIYRLMIELARSKKALLMVSSELPELIGMCDRIYVMGQGRINGELRREEFSAETIMALATGTAKQQPDKKRGA